MRGERRQLKSMDKLKQVYLDANAVLRYVLHDIDDQHDIVLKSVRTEYCVVPLEVMTEVAFVLEGVYGVPREEMVKLFRKLSQEVVISNTDVFLRALEVFDKSPKLDFVDCLMYGYKIARGADVLTFDKKLNKKLNSEG